MFHFFIPYLPLSFAGAFFFKKKIWAYGFPVLLTLIQVLTTQPSLVYFFTGASLLLSVFLLRKARSVWGSSLWALVLYTACGIFLYELISNFGVWLIAGCVAEQPPLYPYTLAGLVQCYRTALPYSLSHFLRDVPLTVLLIKGGGVLARLRVSSQPWFFKHESPR